MKLRDMLGHRGREAVSAWAVVCDFDGTIVDDDVVDRLLERFGRTGWEQLEREWRAGRIGACECMRDQVALLDMDRRELDAFLEGFRPDAAFDGFVATARMLGASICIASDGVDHAIHAILARHGLDALPIASNHLEQVSARSWRLTSPHGKAGCRSGTCKCAVMERLRMTGRQVLLVGDGASDFCAAAHADFVFAKRELVAYCQVRGIAHTAIAGFDDAVALLPRLLGRDVAGAASPRLGATVT